MYGVNVFMIKITRIAVQKRNKSRYNIFVDRGNGEEYGFSVHEDVLIKYRLRKGMEFQEDELLLWIHEDEQKKAYHQCIHYLSYRMRSIEEVRRYLVKKEVQQEHIDTVILQLQEQNLLDDHAFAEAFVRSKKDSSFHGPEKIKQDLRKKGVRDDIINKALYLYPKEEQVEKLQTWLKKQKRDKRLSHQAFTTRLTDRLQRRGFSRTIIAEAMERVRFMDGQEDEWEAIVYQGEKVVRRYKGKYEKWEFEQRVKRALYQRGFSLATINAYVDYLQKED